VSTGRQRISARDYKHAGRTRPLFELTQFRQFGAGLAVGLVLAGFVWIYDHRTDPGHADDPAAVPRPVAPAGKDAAAEAADSEVPASEFAFYDMLPNFEVTVPEPERPVRRKLPDEPVTQPGAYVLQVGAYRNLPGAELLRDKLAKLGIEANILHVSDDTDVWHIVRIGPMRDLTNINAKRRALRAADIDVLVQRAGD